MADKLSKGDAIIMVRKNVVSDGVNIISKAWNEVKKINWHEVNRLTQQNFYIGLVGTAEDIRKMREWLASFPYYLAYPGIEQRIRSERRVMDKHVAEIPAVNGEYDEKLIKSANFCIAAETAANDVRKHKTDVYIFDPFDNDNLPAQILSNHHDLRFGLSNTFPVFRPKHANREIENTAFQNTLWVVVSGVPGSIPGPHQALAAPIEGITDFTILTVNEVKMMFELVGISGFQVRPLHRLLEFGFILATAKLAQSLAAFLAARTPAGSRLVVKGAIAYAFTWAIGEAIFFSLSSGHKFGKRLFRKRVRHHFARGRQIASSIISPSGHVLIH